jgi:hypothetical protein
MRLPHGAFVHAPLAQSRERMERDSDSATAQAAVNRPLARRPRTAHPSGHLHHTEAGLSERGSFSPPHRAAIGRLPMPEGSRSPEPPAPPPPPPHGPERKFGPFAGGIGVAVWLNRVEGDDGTTRQVRSTLLYD